MEALSERLIGNLIMDGLLSISQWVEKTLDPWTARRPNQSTLKEVSSEYSLEGLMLKLKLQYFGYLMGRTDSFEKILILGKIQGRRRRGQDEMVRWHHRLNGHEFGWTLGVGNGQGGLVLCSPWGCRLSNWPELNYFDPYS